MVLGVLRIARTARARWEPVSLLAGVLLTVIGFVRPAVSGAFLLGLFVLIAALLKGIRDQCRERNPAGWTAPAPPGPGTRRAAQDAAAAAQDAAAAAQDAAAEPARCSMACEYSRPAR
jgi:hypothetical protein